MSTNKVAFLHVNIGSNLGAGGAQRFFIDVYNKFKSFKIKNTNLYFITDSRSHEVFAQSDFFVDQESRNNFLKLFIVNGRLKNVLEQVHWFFQLLIYRWDLIHICQYSHQEYYHRIKLINRLPKFIRPKVVVNFIHCTFPYGYFDSKHPHNKMFHSRFDPMFQNLKVDAVFSWYELFKEFVEENKLFKNSPYIYPIQSYCCDTDKFKPSKEKDNLIVFAARLTEQKNPMMFLEALDIVNRNNKELLVDWKFIICGSGPLEEDVKRFIKRNQLEFVVDLRTNVSDMSEIFGKTKCFISTQHFENFTSLSMNEALAAGNAIISRNVGQTHYYLKDGENGIMMKSDTSEGLAEAILGYLSKPEEHEKMQNSSVEIINNTHNYSNFIPELESFWEKVINN